MPNSTVNSSMVVEEISTLFNVNRFLNMYYTLFLITIGLIGNLITIVIFWRTKLTHTKKTSFYLISLAISDIGFLLIMLFKYFDDRRWLLTFSTHSVACKLSVYFSFIFNFLSCSLIFTFTLQRLCVICFPLRVNFLNLERRSKILVIALFAFACLFYAVTLTLFNVEKLTDQPNIQVCMIGEGFFEKVELFNFLDSLFTLIIPFFGLLIMNAIIIRTLKNSSYNFIIRTSSNRHFSYEPQNTNARGSGSSHQGQNRYAKLPAGVTTGLGLVVADDKSNSYHGYRNSLMRNYSRQSVKKEFDYYEKDSKLNTNEQDSVVIGNNSSFVKYKCTGDMPSTTVQTNTKNNKVYKSSKCRCFNCASLRKCKLIKTNDAIFSSNFMNSNDSVFKHDRSKKGGEQTNFLRKKSLGHLSPSMNLSEDIRKNSKKYNGESKNNSLKKPSGEQTPTGGSNLMGRTSFRIGGSKTNSVSRKVTKMLIVVSSTFLVLNLPVHSINIYIKIKRSIYGQNNRIEYELREFFHYLFYTSFSCNFLLYSISGVTFRTEFKRLLFKIFRIKSKTIK